MDNMNNNLIDSLKNKINILERCVLRTPPGLDTEFVLDYYEKYINRPFVLKNMILNNKYTSKEREELIFVYESILSRYAAYIGLYSTFAGEPVLPHMYFGIFVSNNAVIGKNVVIFPKVTIGSIGLNNHSGAPVIGDNCYIGSNANIIGNVTIGNNCRIGAGCTVVCDLLPNSVCVSQPPRIIQHEEILNNAFIPIS